MNFQTHIKKNPILYIALAVVIVYAYTKFFRKEGQRAGVKPIMKGLMLHRSDLDKNGPFYNLAFAIYTAADRQSDKDTIEQGFSQLRDKMKKYPSTKITFQGALDQILIRLEGTSMYKTANNIVEEERQSVQALDERFIPVRAASSVGDRIKTVLTPTNDIGGGAAAAAVAAMTARDEYRRGDRDRRDDIGGGASAAAATADAADRPRPESMSPEEKQRRRDIEREQRESNGESEYQPPDQLSLRLSMGNGFLNCEPVKGKPNTALCRWGDNRRN
jgi:hypothetical protein